MVSRELHEGPLKGHFVIKIMQRKILDVGRWILVVNYVQCA